ncbi:MAG TPA: alpha-1,4-glucan--maltose-1-phosphate maltosyltransferase [Xanthobacteraceae bacterium]|nr:alpha-1,4-glucan--maltose-1-phosphate maltosyltransferase [Xanthobacteraceae bacterium]
MVANVTANVPLSSVSTLAGQRIYIEDVYPAVDGGRFAVKRIAGEAVDVWADIFRDGHVILAADLLWRRETEEKWSRQPMRLDGNDRWTASFTPPQPGRYLYAIEAWTDVFATWRHDFLAKRAAGLDVSLEAQEGRLLIGTLTPRNRTDSERLREAWRQSEESKDAEPLLAEDVKAAASKVQHSDVTRSNVFPLYADRPLARAGAWYEMMPRSQSRLPGKHGTFADCIARLPEIAALGFDVLYLTPIHPIGHTNRKGRNNSLRAEPGDPGSPYAIGSEAGGHDTIHPELGTIEDFRRLVAECAKHKMEVALDFAIQCSPDHPWVKQHPEWFQRRPDGSIKYAENPPKKYEDIVNPDFYCADREQLWEALRDVVLFWREQGVRVFRVDNPHTKPFPFWEWLIREVQSIDPGVIFLSEAFTRPKLMKALAKLGFTQSYTYFTWRTGKDELQSYFSELTRYPEREYLRPNLFVNTPDILPFHLQSGDPRMFKTRAALAATLSGNYGIHNGYELIEHEPIPGKEEYLNSEKYEIKTRDWNKPGNIKAYIGQLNRMRKENPALQQTSDLRFAQVDDGEVIGLVKESPAQGNAVAVAIALSHTTPREFWFHFGDMEIGRPGARGAVKAIEDLVTGEYHAVQWGGVRLRIDPNRDPALFFRCIS